MCQTENAFLFNDSFWGDLKTYRWTYAIPYTMNDKLFWHSPILQNYSKICNILYFDAGFIYKRVLTYLDRGTSIYKVSADRI